MYKKEKFEELLHEKILKSPKQMTKDEYRYISSYLGDKNFLVFGTGHDTPLWKYSNYNGKTIFLENKFEWIDSSDTTVLTVNYTTRLYMYQKLLKEYDDGYFNNLDMQLPQNVLETEWDCIFVDSPVGTKNNKPGRMQSIFMAAKIANNSTEVFIHDCDRIVENQYSKAMFKKEIKFLTKLKHVREPKH